MPASPLTLVHLVQLLTDDIITACVLLHRTPDHELSFAYVNPAYSRMSGYSQDEMRGRAVQDLDGSATDVAVMHRIRTAMRAGQSLRAVRTTTRKSGEIYMCELAVRPLQDGAGQIEYFLVFEREVRRRRGRPPQTGQRYEPVDAEQSDAERLFSVD